MPNTRELKEPVKSGHHASSQKSANKLALVRAVQARKQLQREVYMLQKSLIEIPKVSVEHLHHVCLWTTPSEWVDIVDERVSMACCGYPRCPNHISEKQQKKWNQQIQVSLQTKSLERIHAPAGYCSSLCCKASALVFGQLDNTKSHYRTQDGIAYQVQLLEEVNLDVSLPSNTNKLSSGVTSTTSPDISDDKPSNNVTISATRASNESLDQSSKSQTQRSTQNAHEHRATPNLSEMMTHTLESLSIVAHETPDNSLVRAPSTADALNGSFIEGMFVADASEPKQKRHNRTAIMNTSKLPSKPSAAALQTSASNTEISDTTMRDSHSSTKDATMISSTTDTVTELQQQVTNRIRGLASNGCRRDISQSTKHNYFAKASDDTEEIISLSDMQKKRESNRARRRQVAQARQPPAPKPPAKRPPLPTREEWLASRINQAREGLIHFDTIPGFSSAIAGAQQGTPTTDEDKQLLRAFGISKIKGQAARSLKSTNVNSSHKSSSGSSTRGAKSRQLRPSPLSQSSTVPLNQSQSKTTTVSRRTSPLSITELGELVLSKPRRKYNQQLPNAGHVKSNGAVTKNINQSTPSNAATSSMRLSNNANVSGVDSASSMTDVEHNSLQSNVSVSSSQQLGNTRSLAELSTKNHSISETHIDALKETNVCDERPVSNGDTAASTNVMHTTENLAVSGSTTHSHTFTDTIEGDWDTQDDASLTDLSSISSGEGPMWDADDWFSERLKGAQTGIPESVTIHPSDDDQVSNTDASNLIKFPDSEKAAVGPEKSAAGPEKTNVGLDTADAESNTPDVGLDRMDISEKAVVGLDRMDGSEKADVGLDRMDISEKADVGLDRMDSPEKAVGFGSIMHIMTSDDVKHAMNVHQNKISTATLSSNTQPTTTAVETQNALVQTNIHSGSTTHQTSTLSRNVTSASSYTTDTSISTIPDNQTSLVNNSVSSNIPKSTDASNSSLQKPTSSNQRKSVRFAPDVKDSANKGSKSRLHTTQTTSATQHPEKESMMNDATSLCVSKSDFGISSMYATIIDLLQEWVDPYITSVRIQDLLEEQRSNSDTTHMLHGATKHDTTSEVEIPLNDANSSNMSIKQENTEPKPDTNDNEHPEYDPILLERQKAVLQNVYRQLGRLQAKFGLTILRSIDTMQSIRRIVHRLIMTFSIYNGVPSLSTDTWSSIALVLIAVAFIVAPTHVWMGAYTHSTQTNSSSLCYTGNNAIDDKLKIAQTIVRANLTSVTSQLGITEEQFTILLRVILCGGDLSPETSEQIPGTCPIDISKLIEDALGLEIRRPLPDRVKPDENRSSNQQQKKKPLSSAERKELLQVERQRLQQLSNVDYLSEIQRKMQLAEQRVGFTS